jgi:predicted dehydrogenase
VGLVGASSFAQGMHLPNMQKLDNTLTLHAVMSRTGSNAKAVADQYGARYCTTSIEEVLADPEIDLVMVTSRHDLHGSSVLQALAAGKHVFVEKPLTLDPQDLDHIEAFYRRRPDGPLLMVGYNRRFAPSMTHCMDVLKERTTPMIVNYRMNAGFIARDHWVHGPEGGGRNLGEACHIYDLFNALVGGCAHVHVSAAAIRPSGPQWGRNDNFVATISYEDGSVCNLTYTALGDKGYPKERMDIFVDGKVLSVDDYKSFSVSGARHKPWSAPAAQKGQFEELQALATALRGEGAWPIPLDQLIRASRISFDVESLLTSNV